jgi:predicted permease
MLLKDLLFAGRALRKSPALTLTAVVTIALGISSSTAIFSVVNAVLLRPLPYRDPDRLVVAYMDLRRRADYSMAFSTENFVDIRNAAKGTFEDFAAVRTRRQILPAKDGTPEQIRIAEVTTNFFSVMGARIVLGRGFEEADGEPQPIQADGAPDKQAASQLPAKVVLSYEFWQRRYGGDRNLLGHNLTDGAPRASEIVGVLAPGFELLFNPEDNVESNPDIWIASRLRYNNANRNGYSLRPIGRLKPGVTVERAQAEVESAAAQIRKNFSLYGTAGFYARLERMHRALVHQVRPALVALMGAVLFLLLIACANVTNLLLVRASMRTRELVMRAALGASRWRLARHVIAEAFLLAIPGIALGIALAWFSLHELLAIAPADLPRLGSIQIDRPVVAFSVVTGLAAVLLAGLAPALGAIRMDLMSVIRGSGYAGVLGGRSVLRNLIVIVEVALSFVLLVGSGLMFRSFFELQRTQLGFDAHGLLTFHVLARDSGVRARSGAAANQIRDRLRAIPGVENAAAAFPFPLTGIFSTVRWGTAEALADNSKYQAANFQDVEPGYFETLHTPLIEGHVFTDEDNQPDRNVVVIDQLLAAKAFPHESAIGKRLLFRIRTPEPEWFEVVGVVAHQRLTSLTEPGHEQVFVPAGLTQPLGQTYWAVRTRGNPATYAATIRAEMARIDPSLLVTNVVPMENLVWRAQARTRFSLTLISLFAVIAGLLVAVGLYGVLSTAVRQKTPEIGVRVAMGATQLGIQRLVIGYAVRLSAAGLATGVVAALALTRVMNSLLIGVRATDPITYVVMIVVFAFLAVVSAWLPARRAAALNPVAALREQ